MNSESHDDGTLARSGPSSPPTTHIIDISVNPSRRLPVRQMNRSPNPPRGSLAYIRLQSRQKLFIIQVYCLAMAFVSLTMLEWVLIISNETVSEFFKARYYLSFVAGLCAFLVMTIFVGFLEIRYTEPFNWIFAFTIVELETIALLWAPLDSEISTLTFCFLSAVGINAAFTLIGKMIPMDLTKEIMLLTILSFVFYITASVIVIVLIATEVYALKLYLIVGMLLLLAGYIVYTSQLITGGRTGIIRWNDFIMAALLVYINFVVILSLTLYLAEELM